MSQQISSTPAAVPAASHAWLELWWKAFTHPSVATFASIANDARSSRNAAYGWVVRAALVAGFILGLTQSRASFGGICLGVILAALFSLLLFTAGASHWIARALGGSGTYDTLAFATAAYFAPSLLIGTALNMIPYAGLFVILLWIYQLVLNVVAVKAVHHLSWVQAVVPSVVLAVLNIMAIACVLVAMIALDVQQAGG